MIVLGASSYLAAILNLNLHLYVFIETVMLFSKKQLSLCVQYFNSNNRIKDTKLSILTTLKFPIFMNEFLNYIFENCKSFFKSLWERCTSFIGNHYIVIILLVLYICFHSFWENLADKYIINNLLSTLKEGSIVVDIIFILILIYCIINCVIQIIEDNCKRPKILPETIVLCFWVYYSCFSKRYTFTGLYLLKNISYFDIIPIYYFCKQFPFLWDRITSLLIGNHELIVSRKGFSRDIPITNETEDFYDRDAIAASEIEKIIETDTIKDSFSYGLDASWGSGKTSFMNLMKDHIYKEYSNSCIVMDFNPWLFSSEKNLVTLFFDELSKHLKPYDNTLADSIIDYSKALSSIASSSTELKFITDAFDLSHQSSTLQAKVSRIKKAILNIGKKIVVFVDDIDRLDTSELMEMLKLIRNISDFPKMYFVVAYDKSYLINILKEKMANKELDFTEKIFQSEFHLPHCTIESLKDTLYNALKKYLNESDRKVVHDCIFDEEKTILSIGAITSLRDIKRIANSFFSSYSQLKGEVNGRDLLLLEILKVKYPMVYSLFEEKRTEFLIKDSNDERYWVLRENIIHDINNNHKSEDVINLHMGSHKQYLSITDDDIIVITTILILLFPKSDRRDNKQEKCINLVDCTNRYFNLSINDIPKRHFEEILKNNDEEVELRFKQWFCKWPRSLTLRLREYSPKRLSQQKKIIKLFIHLVSEDTTSYFTTQAISDLLAQFTLFATDKNIITQAFKENGYSPNLCKYLFDISNDETARRFISFISISDANSIRSSYFSSCLQNPDCDTWKVIDSFRSTGNIIGKADKILDYRDSDIILLRDYIISHFDDSIPFLFNILNEENDSNKQNDKSNEILKTKYSLNELPLLLWKKWSSFTTILSHIKSSKFKTEFLDFYKSYEQNNHSPIAYNFKHIPFDDLGKIHNYVDGEYALMKTITIFLASSSELMEDRIEFADFIFHLNKHYEPRGYRIMLKMWEHLNPSYNNQRKQDEYNTVIRNCDIFVAIFHTKAGKYTLEEFDEAIEESKKREFPLFIYFKELRDKKEPANLKELKKRISDELNHFWGSYDSNDKLHLDFVLWLDRWLNQNSKIKVEDNEVKIDELTVAQFSQLPFAANNSEYQRLIEQLADLNQDIEQLRQEVNINPDNEDFSSSLSQKIITRDNLQKEVQRRQEALLGAAKHISELDRQQVSEKLAKAIEAFENGQLDVANAHLEELLQESDQHYREIYSKLEEPNTNKKQIHDHIERLKQNRDLVHQDIEALLLKTKIVMADTNISIEERIERVKDIYAKADDWANRSAYDEEKYAQLLFDYATFNKKYGNYREAEKVLLRQIELSEILYGENNSQIIKSYNEIGDLYNRIGKYSDAFKYLYKAYNIAQSSHEPNNIDTATTLNSIGEANHYIGDYDKALEYYFKALEIDETILGTEHPDTAIDYNNIGLVYNEQGDYDKALEYYFKALAIREKALGTEHPDTATSYNNIGTVYEDQGNYDRALEYYFKALAIKEKALGIEHPDTATSYNNIGGVYHEQGDYNKALKHYFKALAIVRKVLGEEHPYTASSYNNIGSVYHNQGDYAKGLEYYFKALAIDEKVLGTEHTDTAIDYNNIGAVYKKQGDYDNALEYFFKALAIREKVLGTEHPDTAGSYNNIGLVYYKQGFYDKALEYYFKALAIDEKVLGTEHPDTAIDYNNIGGVYFNQGDIDKALEYIVKAAEIERKRSGGGAG